MCVWLTCRYGFDLSVNNKTIVRLSNVTYEAFAREHQTNNNYNFIAISCIFCSHFTSGFLTWGILCSVTVLCVCAREWAHKSHKIAYVAHITIFELIKIELHTFQAKLWNALKRNNARRRVCSAVCVCVFARGKCARTRVMQLIHIVHASGIHQI